MARTNLGRIRTVFKGEWTAVSYVVDDVVLYGGSAYTCIAIAAAANDPTDTAFWVKSVGGVEFTGAWDTAVAYKVDQIVTSEGSSFIAISNNTGTPPVVSGNAAWILFAAGGNIADQTGNAGKVLGTDGTSTSWVAGDPDQTGNAGKVLKTDGSVTSWTNVGVTELGITDGESGDFLSTDGSGTLSFAAPSGSGPAFSEALVIGQSGSSGGGGVRAEFPEGSPTPVGTGIMSNPTGTCKVCCSSFACGGGCDTYWTVPSGVTKVQWQVWGAGAGGAVGCCCGGGQYGGNGAYVTTTMNVNAGDSFHVVAGCSCQRMCCSNDWAGYGCGSYVTGPGISCLCADGGCTQNCDVMNCERNHRGMSSCHKFQNFECTSSGPCYCSSGEYCFSSSCATCGFVDNHLNSARNGCVNISSSCNPTNSFTLGSYHGGGCLDTNNYGWHTQPPHIDETHVMSDSSNTTNWDWCFSFTSHTCIGGCQCNCKNWKPGFGGYGSHVMGGYTSYKGSIGNGGMVKISWK